ncbi:rRNA methyltransferase 2, mitochondrial isoform X3 [Tribolium castaneum]|uniref:rRNA methyltransferase 2, mitochondrial isoform X3 n=1 Tax=Tribolium castaneum TaxID=7070 RepID=UPI00077DEEEC|nr:PREDICTED: rRNA methyltransferase 2, mitochondrial isoform X2 [Tribolium castaneum]|eukprot:XP_015838514.1 PREDICTED: rRNA methyltransferase 2, mitochondrial isoform X2 [Tribolium castaneum]
MVLIHVVRGFGTTMRHLKSVKLKKVKGASSHEWLSRQLTDPYVEKAKIMNYSAFKLLEIDDRFKILRPGFVVIDCGAAPGSWSQVAVRRVNSDGSDPKQAQGLVLSIDKQQIFAINGATILGNLDFTDVKSQEILVEVLGGKKADAVISDMAPNASGFKELDNENIIKLCYSVLRFAVQNSRAGACLVVKLWQCGQAKQLENDFSKFYASVKYVKPNSSRSDSAEIFLLGRDFKGLKN